MVKEVFCKKYVLEIFEKFTGKHLHQSIFLNKVVGFRPATLLKKRLWRMFSCEFCQIFKNTFFYRTSLDNCFCTMYIYIIQYLYPICCTFLWFSYNFCWDDNKTVTFNIEFTRTNKQVETVADFNRLHSLQENNFSWKVSLVWNIIFLRLL